MTFTQQQLIERLKKHFPDPKIELNYENEFQLLIVIILSAQATDKKVNQVSPILFKKYPTPQALANADLKDLEEILKPLGYYRRKAKLIKECTKAIVEKFSGQIPKTLEELTSLPGVGRKTASALVLFSRYICTANKPKCKESCF